MGLFNKFNIDALAAAGKAAGMLGQQLEQAQQKLAPKLNELRENAAPSIEKFKEKATALASDVKEAIRGPDLDKINAYDLKNMYQAKAIDINFSLQHLKLEGAHYELEVHEGPYMMLYDVQGGQRKQVNKLDALTVEHGQRGDVLKLVNSVEQANDIVIALRQKESNPAFPQLHQILPTAHFKSSSTVKSPELEM